MHKRDPFVVATLTFLTLSSVVLLVRFCQFINLSDEVIRYVCEESRCTVQDWLASTAGWVGLIAAGIGAMLVYWQLREQRVQTAFMLGEGMPTLDIELFSLKSRRAVFCVTNWNRRGIFLKRVQVSCQGEGFPELIGIWHGEEALYLSTLFTIGSDRELDIWPVAKGWRDRQASPDTCMFSLAFSKGPENWSELDIAKDRSTAATVTIAYNFAGSVPAILSVTLPVRDLLPRD